MRSRILMDVSNLSIHSKKFIRTGIQEVIYQTLASCVNIREEFPDLEIVLLPQIPRRFGNAITNSTAVPYQNPCPEILQAVEEELRLPSSAIWGFPLKNLGYRLSEEKTLEWIASSEAFHTAGMVSMHSLATRLRELGSKSAQNLNMTVHDLGPIFFPEYCDHGLARWFQNSYLPDMGKYVQHAICVSQNTARDLRQNPLTSKIPKISALPLPQATAEPAPSVSSLLEKFHLNKHEYLVSLGSLEPRKNFEGLLAGFEVYQKLNPSSQVKLVFIGSTGWKNANIEAKIRTSSTRDSVVRTGYLPDAEMISLLDHSAGLVMVSHYEGFGLPVAQAFSRGVPVVTTLGSSLPEACRGQGTFVEPYDPFSIAAGIQRVHRISKEGLEKRRPPKLSFTWDDYARQLVRTVSGKFDSD